MQLLRYLIIKIVRYVAEVLLGAYVPVILGLPVGIALAGLFQFLKWRLAMRMIDEPFFVLEIAIAIVCAIVFCKYTRRRPSTLVWIPVTIILIWSLFTWNTYPGQIPYWKDVWNNYFGRGCGSSECLYELTATAPFYCSVAYSLTGLFLRFKRFSGARP